MVLPDECELVSVGHQTPESDLGNVRAVLLGAKHSFQILPQLRSRRSQVRPQLDQGSILIPLIQRTELGHRDRVAGARRCRRQDGRQGGRRPGLSRYEGLPPSLQLQALWDVARLFQNTRKADPKWPIEGP